FDPNDKIYIVLIKMYEFVKQKKYLGPKVGIVERIIEYNNVDYINYQLIDYIASLLYFNTYEIIYLGKIEELREMYNLTNSSILKFIIIAINKILKEKNTKNSNF